MGIPNAKTADLPLPVYPGHPVVIALHVMRVFPSAKAALRDDNGIDDKSLINNGSIPGGGNAVYQTAKMLRDMWTGHLTVGGAKNHAFRVWNSLDGAGPNSGYEKSFDEGQAQANLLWKQFEEAMAAWDWSWDSKPEFKKLKKMNTYGLEAFEVTDNTLDLGLQCRYLGIVMKDLKTGKWAMSWNAIFACKGEDAKRFMFKTQEEAVAALTKLRAPK